MRARTRRTARRRGSAALGVLIAAVALCSGCAAPAGAGAAPGSAATASSPSPTSPQTLTPTSTPTSRTTLDPMIAGGYPFGTSSFWRSSLVGAPLDPTSRARVDYLVSTITDRYSGVAAFNAHQYDSHLYAVSPSTPTVDFAYSNCQHKATVPSGLFGAGGQFEDVPVPAGALPAVGSDAEISFYSPATDQLWEFWKAQKAADGTWSACWGGRMDGVSTSLGYFLGGFGATATGLPNAGGAVRLSEIQAGRIDHAISISIPAPAVASDFSWPAQRSDGSDTNPAAMREGARLRLDPSLDLSTLRLTPAGLVIARAAQQYGFVVVDKSGSVSVIAEAVDKVDGVDPWYTALKTPDYAVLKNFPWSSLQVVQKDYGKPATP